MTYLAFSQLFWCHHFFPFIRNYFRIVGQGYFIITVHTMDDGEGLIRLLKEVIIDARHLKAINSNKLKLRKCGIHHRAKHIKKGPDAEIFSDGTYCFQMPDETWGHEENKYSPLLLLSSSDPGHS